MKEMDKDFLLESETARSCSMIMRKNTPSWITTATQSQGNRGDRHFGQYHRYLGGDHYKWR